MNLQNTTIGKLPAAVAVLTAMLLLIPFVAMKFTHEVSWTAQDFIAASVLLFGAGACIAFVLKFVSSRLYRWLLVGLIALILLVIWADLAVGIFH
ncbi:MAG: hypothetical protein ACO24O_08590 [Arenimonas sp.]